MTGIGIILIAINIVALCIWMFENTGPIHEQRELEIVAESIIKEKGSYSATEECKQIIDEKYAFAMLIDENGNVVWNRNLPDDVPRHYTLSEVAGFSRWYLKDYPVGVWRNETGIVVLGSPKGSYWKYNLEYDMNSIRRLPQYGIYFLGINGLLNFLLALGLGLILYKSLKPLASGIEKLSKREETDLATTGVLGDLSEKINITSERLKKQDELLQKRDYARLNWIRGISHDIRTPLSMIMGYAAQIEEDESLGYQSREQAMIIKRQSTKIRDLVNDLNLASKLEYDMQPIKIDKIYPAEIIRHIAASFLNDQIGEKNSIELDISDTAQGSCMMGDTTLLGRALTNIIINSVKHNLDGVEITISARCIRNYYEICVEDNGQGVTKEKLAKLCTPHKHTLEDDNQELPHGMGLLIVEKIIDAHRGQWYILSEEGKGFSYIIQIPLSKSHL